MITPAKGAPRPDRAPDISPCGDGFDYGEDVDHNSKRMMRGTVAIQLNPLPEGIEPFDVAAEGAAYLEAGLVRFYGAGL